MSEFDGAKDKVTTASQEDSEYLLHRIVPDNFIVYLLVLEGKRKGKGRFEIKDLGSTNGIIVNGKRVEKSELKNKDTIKIGKIFSRFILEIK